jgi:RNA polymerase sigma factor (sigma-70 family)
MTEQTPLSFEEIVKQNERRVHYYIHKLNVRDPHQEFYQEGLVAMWNAYEKHQPDKGPLATYFNYTIKNRMIDLIRKKTREQQGDEQYIETEKNTLGSGNRDGRTKMPIPDYTGLTVDDAGVWIEVQQLLTENQWKWVYGFIILNMPLKEIAEMEGVSSEAVKSWGRQARKKLRSEDALGKLQGLLEV